MLYIVATPIGNLEDLSIRQAKTLLSCEYILSEDTRSTGFILQKIRELFPHLLTPNETTTESGRSGTKLISYYKEREFEKLPEVLSLLREGADIALISESGMPLISDPGSLLIKHVIKEKIPFTVIPGPTAAVNALVLAGMNTKHFLFIGFVPKKKSELTRLINQLSQIKKMIEDLPIIFYESPHRIHSSLQLFSELIPDAQISICREMTKKFEEVTRGTPAELMKREYKGELTIVISNY